MVQDGDNGLQKSKAMEAMLKTLHTKMAQAEFDLKKAKYQPDPRFKKDFKGCMDNIKKLLGNLDTVLVQRNCKRALQKGMTHLLCRRAKGIGIVGLWIRFVFAFRVSVFGLFHCRVLGNWVSR